MKTAMKRNSLILLGLLSSQFAFAVTNLVIIGRGNAPTNTSFGDRPPPWLPYVIPSIFLVAGLVNIIFPRFGWWLKWGWQFKDAPEPSGLWIFGERCGGVILIVIAIAVFCGFKTLIAK